MNYPRISIIIVTRNSERTIKECLKYIKSQDYPEINEVLIVDGGSTDKTISIAKNSNLPIKIIHGGYPENQEARRAVGIERANNEYCVSIDSDNYIMQKYWLKDMIEPLIIHKDIVASQTLRYSAPKSETLFNRYFGLLGAGDPVAFYLGKADRLSWAYDRWNLLGTIKDDNKAYYIIDFDPENMPTVGCNGLIFRKSLLLKSHWKKHEDFIHTDVFVDIARRGYHRYAIVKNEIFHNTADNIFSFFQKRFTYMKMYYQSMHHNRRHLIFSHKNKNDIIRLVLFIVLAFTLVEPLVFSFRGFLKKRDIAWFLHPVITLGIMFIYIYATVLRLFNSLYKKI